MMAIHWPIRSEHEGVNQPIAVPINPNPIFLPVSGRKNQRSWKCGRMAIEQTKPERKDEEAGK